MATELKLRRGTTSQHSSFTGAEAEVTVDTDKETVVVHDGSTAGGYTLAREDMSNVTDPSFNSINVDSGTLFVDSANNRVGVGTSSPGEALTVDGKLKTKNFELSTSNSFEVTVYVDPISGDDDNSGFSSSDAYQTVKAAIEKSPPFGQIAIVFVQAEGTYISNVSDGSTRSYINIPAFTAKNKTIRLTTNGADPDLVFSSGNTLIDSNLYFHRNDRVFFPSGTVFNIGGATSTVGIQGFGFESIFYPLSNNQTTFGVFRLQGRLAQANAGYLFKLITNGASRVGEFRLLDVDQGTPTGGVGDGTHTGRLNIFGLTNQGTTTNPYVMTNTLSLENEGDSVNGWFYRDGVDNEYAVASAPGTDLGIVSRYRSTLDTFSYAGDVVIAGSLSKGSGSFRIDHPLPEKSETHHLVHSFVESPLANNIYRGITILTDGTAHVNIDNYTGMTEGTFSALNGNPQIFLQNESGFEPVKGNITGNILHIQCRDETATDTISWMVVAERQDQHMLDTEWTDEFGRPVLEPEKNPEPDEELDSDVDGVEE